MKFITLTAIAFGVAAQASSLPEASDIQETQPLEGRTLDGFAVVKRNKCEKAFTGCLKEQVGTHACQCDQGKVVSFSSSSRYISSSTNKHCN